ncbi:hypothetical protein K4F52_005293 [Lecanicillium sp. MT-2017a]|nr:hypothetical protein K4F52_005293 [Lecanicillium sp. MT-2017a]
MKFSILPSLALAGAVMAEAELSGFQSSSKMEGMMQMKQSHRDAQRAAGVFDMNRYQIAAATKCQNGKAGEYSCNNVDLQGHLRHQDMGSRSREGSDLWGWTSSDGREFAIAAQADGTAFVEILAGGELKYVGRLPTQTGSVIWRDMKVIGDHVYIGSEARGHGMQVFDLRKLLNVRSPKTFSTKNDLTAWFSEFGSSHNIIANEETNTIFAVGATDNAACSGSRGGLIMVDVSDPSNPTLAGCNGKDGYVHDAQCVVYNGIDKDFQGREICFGYNEDTLTIYDVTNKANSSIISRTSYDGHAYTHQGWNVDPDFKYLLLDDELDEQQTSETGQTVTYVFDISSLANPVWTGQYIAPHKSIDHNQYIIDYVSYQANYGSGLRVLDVKSVVNDPSGGGIKELASFDCYPEDDKNPQAEFHGAWSVYPYFASGTVILNCIERGLFSLKVNI